MEREFTQNELRELEEKARTACGVSTDRLQAEYAELLRRARKSHSKPDCRLALMLDERMRYIPMTSQLRIFHIATLLIVTKDWKPLEDAAGGRS